MVVGKVAENQPADRPHDEADGEQDRGIELLNNRIVTWEKRVGEIQREGRIRVKVVPLDQVADRPDEDGLDTPAHVGVPEGSDRLTHGVHRTRST